MYVGQSNIMRQTVSQLAQIPHKRYTHGSWNNSRVKP